jgi:hypothetical protein
MNRVQEFLCHGAGCGLGGPGGRVGRLAALTALQELGEAGEDGKVVEGEALVVAELAWGEAGLEVRDDSSRLAVVGDWSRGPGPLPRLVAVDRWSLVPGPGRPTLLARRWRELPGVEGGDARPSREEGGVRAVVVERGPVVAGPGGLHCLAVLEVEGEAGRCLVRVEALATVLGWGPGAQLLLPPGALLPPRGPASWDHSALLGPLPRLRLPPGSPVQVLALGHLPPGYTVGQLGEAPVGELVTVRGVLAGHGEDCLMLEGEDREEGVSLYLTPPALGLPPGLPVEASGVLRAVSRRGRPYLASTPLTRLEPRPGAPPPAAAPARLLSLESVLSLRLEAACPACASPLRAGACSYIGCSSVGGPVWTVKAVLGVLGGGLEAGPAGALPALVCTGLEEARQLLGVTPAGWAELASLAAARGGITPSDCPRLQEVVRAALGSVRYMRVRARALARGRYYCTAVTPAEPGDLITYYEAELARLGD